MNVSYYETKLARGWRDSVVMNYHHTYYILRLITLQDIFRRCKKRRIEIGEEPISMHRSAMTQLSTDNYQRYIIFVDVYIYQPFPINSQINHGVNSSEINFLTMSFQQL